MRSILSFSVPIVIILGAFTFVLEAKATTPECENLAKKVAEDALRSNMKNVLVPNGVRIKSVSTNSSELYRGAVGGINDLSVVWFEIEDRLDPAYGYRRVVLVRTRHYSSEPDYCQVRSIEVIGYQLRR